MSEQRKIFIVVDPSNNSHVALERAIIISSFLTPSPKICVFVAVDGEAVDTRVINDNLFRNQTWFGEQIKKPLEAAGLEYEIQVCWSTQWQNAIVQEAKRFHADEIYLPIHRQIENSRFTFSESKWSLLKCSHCPVVLVRPGAEEKRQVVLAAVNFQAVTDEQREINRLILERGKMAADNYGAEFHVVNGYLNSMTYPDRGRLAHATQLPAERIHVREGYTADVVAEVVKDISADLVIMGTLGQNGMTSTLRRGNTAERVISAVKTDIMVFNA